MEHLAESSAYSDLFPAVERFANARVLCVGDIMLDRFVYGKVERISPEAPIPVIRQDREETMLGGAGNVVRNITSLGAKCCFLSVVGDDAIGRQLIGLVGEQELLEPYLITEAGRKSTMKTRYVSGNQQLLRCDDESDATIKPQTEDALLQIAMDEIPNYQSIVLSDYGKGVLSDKVITAMIEKAREHDIPVFVDPKRPNFSIYANATLISPNLKELTATTDKSYLNNAAEIEEAAQAQLKAHHFTHMLVTQGKDGMTLFESGSAEQTHIPAQARDVYDVSGAGDTVIATVAVAYASGLTMAQAALIANIAAGVVVGRLGTATIYRTDIKTALYTHDATSHQAKVMPRDIAQDMVYNWKSQGLSVGFTNGCFDVLHVGHLQSLHDAKSHCDRLMVAINSDDSVRRLKGDSRPINSEMDRAMLLAGLDCVDLVVIFREDTPLELIGLFKPDVLMKGADYTKETVVGADIVEAYGGRIELLPLREGYSSTTIIEKAKTGS